MFNANLPAQTKPTLKKQDNIKIERVTSTFGLDIKPKISIKLWAKAIALIMLR